MGVDIYLEVPCACMLTSSTDDSVLARIDVFRPRALYWSLPFIFSWYIHLKGKTTTDIDNAEYGHRNGGKASEFKNGRSVGFHLDI